MGGNVGQKNNRGCRQNAVGDERMKLAAEIAELEQMGILKRALYIRPNGLVGELHHEKSFEGSFLHSFKEWMRHYND
jgi:hypothetical protein